MGDRRGGGRAASQAWEGEVMLDFNHRPAFHERVTGVIDAALRLKDIGHFHTHVHLKMRHGKRRSDGETGAK